MGMGMHHSSILVLLPMRNLRCLMRHYTGAQCMQLSVTKDNAVKRTILTRPFHTDI